MEPIRENKERFYTPKEVSEQLKISTDLLRKWTEEFNIQTQWTQANNKGHRRFSQENVEILLAVREKIQEQKWSWDQVRAWRNGVTDIFTAHEEKTNLEKKMDLLLEKQEDQLQFNKALLERIDLLTRELGNTTQKLLAAEEREKEQEKIHELLERKLAEHDEKLLSSIHKNQEVKTKKKWWKFGGVKKA